MTLLSPPPSDTTVCPSCDAALDVDPRYVTWCTACEWNIDPGGEEENSATRAARRAARRRARDRAQAERLYADVAAAPDARPGRNADWAVATAVAGAVHLVTLALTALAVWLLIVGPTVMRVLGVVCLLFAVVLRPRLGKAPDDEWLVDRDSAPRLHGLVDRVATELGAPAVDVVRVTPEFGASYGQAGLRRRRTLTIALALWEVLGPREKVALLGHELGHAVNGDNRRSLWLYSAQLTLLHWRDLLRPGHPTGDTFLYVVAWWLTVAVLFGPRVFCLLLLRLLHRLTLRDGQRAEYYADGIAARLASSEAAVALLETLTRADTVGTYLSRETARFRSRLGRRPGSPVPAEAVERLWGGLKADVASMPPAEHERQLRLSVRRMSCVDTTHPPTHLRIRLAASRGLREAVLVCDEAEAAAITAELSEVRGRAARSLLDDGPYRD
jgi:Zn-dependent protease with chaperone function